MNISAGLGVAVPEFPLRGGFADSLLCGDGKSGIPPSWIEGLARRKMLEAALDRLVGD